MTDRLVRSPVFILSPMRSGSTLLRVLLDSHSHIRAPHELHLRTLGVNFAETYTELAMQRLGLARDDLEHLLWDRLLHWELTRSGKRVIVDKTPANALGWSRLRDCWPDARYIFLLRHPGTMHASLCEVSPDIAADTLAHVIARFVDGVEAARAELPGLTVRYEDLVADPATVTKELCAFLDVPWEAEMLEYGRFDHGTFEMYLGDFTDKIRSGRIREARATPAPDAVSPILREACRKWGYAD